MKRLAVAVVAVVTAGGLLFVFLSGGADPVRLSSSGVTVRLDDATTGTISAEVAVAADVTEVSLFATMPQMGHIMPETSARQEKPGRFLATGVLFAMAGRWELTVRAGGQVVTFEITVN